ncbi:disks large homolog 5 [Agrilus planipennis]|uniref:Disks large homolog 5 n=1 Tax=Agrilus planipennis TaxID=224129 RepID=A0A1W4WNK6_AGRPL|nr:disks large homolog 5 [Agrilus planipennis]XP_018325505.1 disks large homolog 5 [Agrilus planipennis]
MASSTDGSGSSGALSRNYSINSSSSRDYENLKQQYDKANNELANLRRRCDHAMKELDYYRSQHRAAMNQLEVSSQDSATLRTKYGDVLSENQRLEQDVQSLRTELSELHRQQEVLVSENGNTESLYMLSRRNDSVVRDDCDTLRKRYDELLASHSQAITKLELAQDETNRLNKQCDELNQERNNVMRDIVNLRQQIAVAHQKYDKAARDCIKFREAFQKVQQQYEEAVKEVNQAMAFRMKASKEVKRLTDERNAAMTEYNLIMSERDTVHKEMEKLSDDLTQACKKNKLLEADNKELMEEKKQLNYQMETLRREIASALHDRDKALKECNDLREKFGEYSASKEDSRDMMKSRLDNLSFLGDNAARKEVQVDSRSLSQRQRLDNLDQANQELESLRKSLDKAQTELSEAIQEAEVSKGRRDWAFSERDKIVLERESIRTLCDNMRKERDRAVSELAEALRESDAIKKQRNELMKEVKMLKEALEIHMEKEAQFNQFRGMGHNHSHDSAIDSDMQEWETEILEMDLSGLPSDGDLGFELVGGRDDPHYPNDSGIYVASVSKGSMADGKLRVNDCISRVNNLDCTSVSKRMVIETLRSSLPVAHLVVRRRRSQTWSSSQNSRGSQNVVRIPPSFQNNSRVARWIYTARLAAGCHGLSLESGVYIGKISEGSLAAKDNSLVVGDRVLSINNKSMDGFESIHEAMSILNDDRTDIITITTLKTSYLDPECTTNVFMPAQRYKKENRSSQTDDHDLVRHDYDRQYLSGDYRLNNKSNVQEKNSGAWFREKLDMVRGRRHSKDRNRNDDKKKYRNSSPNTLDLSSNTFEQEQAIAELDLVIDSYHGENTNTMKRNKRRGKEMSVQEKNGGTWPKARATNVLQNTTGTIVARKKERPPLSLLLTDRSEQQNNYCCKNERTSNRNSTPIPLSLAQNLNRHSVFKSVDNSMVPFPKATFSTVNDSFEKLRSNKMSDFDASREVNNRLSINSDNSLDFPVNKPMLISEKDFLNYYKKNKTGPIKYTADSDRDNSITHDISVTGVPNPHTRIHSQLFVPNPRIAFPFHPHPHPHLNSSPLTLPTCHSRESVGFEPPYPSFTHTHSPSVDHYQKKQMLNVNGLPSHAHVPYRDSDMINYGQGFEGGTFPRKKENQRFRIPSNPSVTSKNSAGKVSTGSIERTSERGSPMPIFQVEVLSPGNRDKRNSVPDYCWPQKPLPGELRRVHIDKSNEPLGIQINCPESGGIFVSTVNDNSLASRVGLQIGDQLLEVCGINMRNATYNLAANVLRQCGNSITMLVQYSPDKYNELQDSGSCSGSSSNDEGDGEPTPCNSPKGVRKSHSNAMSLPLTSLGNQTIINRTSQATSTIQRQSSNNRNEEEPRYLYIETLKTSNLGISLVGGNAVGIFIHSVQPDSLAYHAGLRTGDQILEYNGSDLRHATAEEAAYELAKTADKVTVLAHYRVDRYNEIKDKPGDSLYIRCLFDRSGSELSDNLQLCFNKDDILYVDNTMFNGVPGHWRAWKLDSEGQKQQCGIIPNKYKVEEELLLKRSTGDLEGRGSTSARRSFFRRKKHQRSGSRDSKELASFCNVSSGWYSDNGTLHEDLSLCSYQRVERLDYPEFRPVLVLGPLAECIVDKLVNDFPDKFQKVQHEARHCSQATLDQELADSLIVDYRRKGNYYECTTAASIRSVCSSRLHCMLDISVSSVEKLHRHQIYPIVLLIKFKSTKQIKEVKDTRFPLDKLSGKAAKEMYEHGLKLEAEYRHQITAVIPAGVNIAYICTQVKAAIDAEHNKSQWIPVQ